MRDPSARAYLNRAPSFASVSHITLPCRGAPSPTMRSKVGGIPQVDWISRHTPPCEMLRSVEFEQGL